jgi:hypothetical protein
MIEGEDTRSENPVFDTMPIFVILSRAKHPRGKLAGTPARWLDTARELVSHLPSAD